jgi:hypothetical protein
MRSSEFRNGVGEAPAKVIYLSFLPRRPSSPRAGYNTRMDENPYAAPQTEIADRPKPKPPLWLGKPPSKWTMLWMMSAAMAGLTAAWIVSRYFSSR